MLNEAVNHEMESEVMVTVTVTDRGSPGTEIATSTVVTITIADVNEVPGITVKDGETPDGIPAESDIHENTTGPVGAIYLSDEDETLDESHVTVSDPRFGVKTDDEGGIWLMLNEAVNHEMESDITVTVTVTDSGGLKTSTDVEIGIIDVNEAPTLEVTPMMIEENMTGAVGAIMISDEDDTYGAGDVSVSDPRFSVEAGEDGLMLMLNEAIDFDTEGDVTVTVMVVDKGGLSASVEVTIMVGDIDEAPTIEVVNAVTPNGMPAVNARDENSAGPVGQIIISDQEDDLTEANLSVDDTRFSVETDADGGIWLKLDEGVNFEEVGANIDVTVTVEDSGGNTVETVVSVRINDVNEMPTIAVMDSLTLDGMPAASVIDENDTGFCGPGHCYRRGRWSWC